MHKKIREQCIMHAGDLNLKQNNKIGLQTNLHFIYSERKAKEKKITF